MIRYEKIQFEVLIFFRPHKGPTVQDVCGCEKLDEEFMVQVVAQKGPLAVNVDAVLWHDYIGEVFFDKNLWFVFHFRFYS